MCGCFKATTIKSILRDNPDVEAKWSMIKPWKRIEERLFPGMIPRSNLNYAILHLIGLQDIHKETVVVERGVTDMIFYESLSPGDWISRAVDYEASLLGGNPEKILLIQRDRKFIRDIVLQEKTRRDAFPLGVDDFLRQQEKYIKFTKSYNDISSEVVIDDAKRYIEVTLGLEYNNY